MLGHIRKIRKIYFLFATIVFVLGCTNGMTDRGRAMSKLTHMYSVSLNSNGNFVIRYAKYLNENDDMYQCSELMNGEWKNTKCPSNNDLNITIENGIAHYIKQGIEKKEKLPDKAEITDTLGIAFDKADIAYIPFVDGENHTWDYATYFVSIGVNGEQCADDTLCYERLYHIQLEKKNDLWDMKLILTDVSDEDNNIGEIYLYNTIDIRGMTSPFRQELSSLMPISFKKSTPLCGLRYCFVRQDGYIIRKHFNTLYSEYLDPIFDIQMYKDLGGIDDLRSYFFDKEDNLHLFYNDFENLTGKHFIYEKYTKDSPTTPVSQQKIYWKEN